MNKVLDSYYKLDHTCCFNANEKNMKFGCVTDDDMDRDCKNVEEMVDFLDALEVGVVALDIIVEKSVDTFLIIRTEDVNDYNESISYRYSSEALEKHVLTEREYERVKMAIKEFIL